MPICRKCGEGFPNWTKINGVRKNCGSRCYCFRCSPYKAHNTRILDGDPKKPQPLDEKPCSVCGSEKNAKQAGTSTCYICLNKHKEQLRSARIHSVVGYACWLCGYDKGKLGKPAIDFHHIGRKSFPLTTRNIGRIVWKQVLNEVAKCMVVCARCHREVEAGLVNQAHVEKVYGENWVKRREDLAQLVER